MTIATVVTDLKRGAPTANISGPPMRPGIPRRTRQVLELPRRRIQSNSRRIVTARGVEAATPPNMDVIIKKNRHPKPRSWRRATRSVHGHFGLHDPDPALCCHWDKGQGECGRYCEGGSREKAGARKPPPKKPEITLQPKIRTGPRR